MEEAKESLKKEKNSMGSDNIEKEITRAMRDRVAHFKEQADSLTLEGVRRVLEKDLGLETFKLDVHKRFIKQCLQECFDSAEDDNMSKSTRETAKEVVHSTKEEMPDLAEELQAPKEVKEHNSEEDEKLQGSPVLGLLEEDETVQNETGETHDQQIEEAPSEEKIKKAIKKRASYFRTNSTKVTMVDARRLLEDDLKLAKYSLDPYKKFIREHLDQILQRPRDEVPANRDKNKRGKKVSHSDEEQNSESLDSEDEDVSEEEVKLKKKTASKAVTKNKIFKEPKNRKRSATETKTSSSKRKKTEEPNSEEDNDSKDGGDLSEDGQSQSSEEEPVKKKKEAPTLAYGKRVEHLKSVIKSCGMSIPPSIYKRVKQAPEGKREAFLIKELEEILNKEGLSTNPSEKDIKAVKKRKERTKELEGIDLGNIVSTSRRRSSSSTVVPPKPQIPVGSDNEESEEDESNDDDDEDDDGDDNDDDDDDDAEENNSEGTSEEQNEDVEEEDSD